MTDFQAVQPNGVFDCRQYVPVGASRPIIEEGEYPVIITSALISDMKSGNGKALTIEFTIEQGDRAGHKYEETFSLWHSTSTQACEIAHQKLSSLCYVTGIHQVNMANHARELLNSRCVIHLTVEEQKLQTEKGDRIIKQNRLKAFKAFDGRDAATIAEAIPDAKTRTRAVKKTAAAQQQAAVQQAPVYAQQQPAPMPAQYPIDTPQQPAQQGYPAQTPMQQPAQAPWGNLPAQPQQAQQPMPGQTPPAAPWQR